MIKILLTSVGLIVSLLLKGQGSCLSPNGPMFQVFAPPPSYPWLQANGYCNPSNYGKNGTVCWTFTPTMTDVVINSGWAGSGCFVYGPFGPFNLYTCAPACVLIGTGLSFTGLIPGQCYTWCMGYSAAGPPPCKFIDFCPYYQQSGLLPVSLSHFYCDTDKLAWTTVSEINNDYFTLYHSNNFTDWKEINITQARGGNYETNYTYYTNIKGYFKLTQTDLNGSTLTFPIIYCNNSTDNQPILLYNILGQKVSSDYKGLVIDPVIGIYYKF